MLQTTKATGGSGSGSTTPRARPASLSWWDGSGTAPNGNTGSDAATSSSSSSLPPISPGRSSLSSSNNDGSRTPERSRRRSVTIRDERERHAADDDFRLEPVAVDNDTNANGWANGIGNGGGSGWGSGAPIAAPVAGPTYADLLSSLNRASIDSQLFASSSSSTTTPPNNNTIDYYVPSSIMSTANASTSTLDEENSNELIERYKTRWTFGACGRFMTANNTHIFVLVPSENNWSQESVYAFDIRTHTQVTHAYIHTYIHTYILPCR
jgi:hypothetical protein